MPSSEPSNLPSAVEGPSKELEKLRFHRVGGVTRSMDVRFVLRYTLQSQQQYQATLGLLAECLGTSKFEEIEDFRGVQWGLTHAGFLRIGHNPEQDPKVPIDLVARDDDLTTFLVPHRENPNTLILRLLSTSLRDDPWASGECMERKGVGHGSIQGQ